MTNEMSTVEKQGQAGKTADGVQIADGLVVWTNEMAVGRVDLGRMRTFSDGWFDVVYADGKRVLMNGERVATRFQGRSAEKVHANDLALIEAAGGAEHL